MFSTESTAACLLIYQLLRPKEKAPAAGWGDVETTCGESPFTQSIRVALAAVSKCYNPSGNDLSYDLIGMPL